MLEPHERSRGSGDDLEAFFPQFSYGEGWHVRTLVVRSISTRQIPDLVPDDACPQKQWRLALTVVGMGVTRGVDIAEEAREGVLREGGCLLDNETLHYGEVTSAGAKQRKAEYQRH